MEMLSDDGDLFSDEDEPGTSYMSSDGSIRSPGDKILPSAADRRAHHNALERKRRDHIKDSFSSLRDSVPSLQGEKVSASRAQILKKAAEYIQFMRKKNNNVQSDIDNLARQNKMLEEQIRIMERQKGLLSGSSLSILSNGNGTTNGNVTGDSGVVISPTISYECSENSNESGASQSDLTTSAAAVLVNGLAHQNGLDNSSVTVTSTEPAMPPTLPAVTAAANPPAHVVINGTMRSAVMKNGATSTIIVQNPQQLKTTTNGQHDRIYVHTSGKSIHTSGHQATATPIIITTGHHTTGAVNTSTASGAAVTALPQARRSPSSAALPQIGTLPAGALPGTYLVQKAPGPGVTFPNGFRTVVVHGSSTASPTGVTTTNGTPTSNPLSLFGEKKTQGGTVASGTPTPNIHIVSTIPAGAAATYSGRPATKRFKISAELPGESNSNGTTSTSVTSVSS